MFKLVCVVGALTAYLSVDAVEIVGADRLKRCVMSAFGEKLLDGATYVEDAYLKMSSKWVDQQVKIDGVVAKLADGREATVVWPTEKAENEKDPAFRYDTPFFAVPYDSDGNRIAKYSGYVTNAPVYFIKGVEAQFTEVSRRAIRYSKKPMNFVFAHRWTNGEIWLSHSIGRHTRDERHTTMLSKDNGRTWTFDNAPCGGFMCFEKKDGTRACVGSWHMHGKTATNEHVIVVRTYDDNGKPTTRRHKLILPWPGMCGMHRDVQRLFNGRLIAEAWGKLEESGGVEAGGKCANYFLESVDDGETWRYLSVYPYEKGHTEGLFESTLVERKDGSLLAICRTGYSLDGTTRHPLLQFVSHDGGKTWGERREISDNGVAPQATMLSDGTLVVLTGRPNLFLLIDRTGTGEHYEKMMITKARTSAYASLVELKPGRIAVFFDESAFISEPGDTPDNRIMQVEYEYAPNSKK